MARTAQNINARELGFLRPSLRPHRVRGVEDKRLTLNFSSSPAIGLLYEGILHGWAFLPDSSAMFPDEEIYCCSVTLPSCICFRDGLLYAGSILEFSFSPEDIHTRHIPLPEIPAKFMKNLPKTDIQLGTWAVCVCLQSLDLTWMVTKTAWSLSDVNLILGSYGLYLCRYMGRIRAHHGLALQTWLVRAKKRCKILTLEAKSFDQVCTHFHDFFPPQRLPWGK